MDRYLWSCLLLRCFHFLFCRRLHGCTPWRLWIPLLVRYLGGIHYLGHYFGELQVCGFCLLLSFLVSLRCSVLSVAQTKTLREISLRATPLRTSPSPRHKQAYSARSQRSAPRYSAPVPFRGTKQTHFARSQRSAPRYSAPVPLRGTNKYTPRDLSALRHATPHQSLSDAQTNTLRESSALRATLFRTSPSPRSPWRKQRYSAKAQHSAPREETTRRSRCCAPSSSRRPCSKYFPSNEGEWYNSMGIWVTKQRRTPLGLCTNILMVVR